MTTPTPYPWMEDSQYGTTPSVTGYLEVTSPNGLYLANGLKKVEIGKDRIDVYDGTNFVTLVNGEVLANTFIGALNGNATTATKATGIEILLNNNNVDYCVPYATTIGGSSNLLNANNTPTTGFFYNPSTQTLKSQNFSGAFTGTATNATNAVIGTDNASTLVYPTFVKTNGVGNKGLFIDDTTTALSFNPSTGNLTTTTFTGGLSGNATSATTATNATNVAITDDNTTATALYPVFVSDNTGNLSLKVDKTTSPFSYVPSTGLLTAQSFYATPGGTSILSQLTQTGLVVVNGGTSTTTINNNQITCSQVTPASTTTINPTSVSATTFIGALSGNATTATNITGGLGGQVLYQSAANTTTLLPNGTAGQVLASQGTTLPPIWTTSAGLPASPATTNLKYLLFNAGTGGNAWDDVWDTAFSNISLFSAYNPLGSSAPSKTQNMAIGINALGNLTGAGINNLALGMGALSGTGTTTFSNVTALGYNAGNSWGSGQSGECNNVFVGNAAGAFSAGKNNVYIGGRQVAQSASGSNNVIVGGNSLGGGGPGTGGNNTMIGMDTGFSIFSGTATGSNNTYIGYQAGQSPAQTAATANTIILGNGSVTTFKVQVAQSALSDARDKKDFVPLDAGLNFVNELKPIRFEWNKRDGGLEGRKDVGFTAQSLQETQATTGLEIPNLVNDETPDHLCIMPTQLIPVLVKAVQELSAEVKMLKEQIKALSV
jgi:hypothetical protein